MQLRLLYDFHLPLIKEEEASDKKNCVMYHIFPTEDDKYFLCVFDSAIWQRLGSACCV